jgi:hypothetical protein
VNADDDNLYGTNIKTQKTAEKQGTLPDISEEIGLKVNKENKKFCIHVHVL